MQVNEGLRYVRISIYFVLRCCYWAWWIAWSPFVGLFHRAHLTRANFVGLYRRSLTGDRCAGAGREAAGASELRHRRSPLWSYRLNLS